MYKVIFEHRLSGIAYQVYSYETPDPHRIWRETVAGEHYGAMSRTARGMRIVTDEDIDCLWQLSVTPAND